MTAIQILPSHAIAGCQRQGCDTLHADLACGPSIHSRWDQTQHPYGQKEPILAIMLILQYTSNSCWEAKRSKWLECPPNPAFVCMQVTCGPQSLKLLPFVHGLLRERVRPSSKSSLMIKTPCIKFAEYQPGKKSLSAQALLLSAVETCAWTQRHLRWSPTLSHELWRR